MTRPPPERYYAKIISKAGGRKVFYGSLIWVSCFAALWHGHLPPGDFLALTIAIYGTMAGTNVLTKFAKRPPQDTGD